MKTFPLTIQKREFLLCEVPELFIKWEIRHSRLCYAYAGEWHFYMVLDGEHKLIGLYPGLTEQQAAGIVENIPYRETKGTSILYPDYTEEKIEIAGKKLWNYTWKTALESLASKLQAEKIYIGQNPLGEKPHCFGKPDCCFHERCRSLLWQDAEARTIKQAVILEIIK